MFGDILSYLGDTLDKPGRAVRGVLGGRPEELLAAVPFSDSLGLTSPDNAVSGTDLAKRWFDLDPTSFGGQAAGFGLEAGLDPTNLLGFGLAGKAAKGAQVAARTAEEGVRAAKEANIFRDTLLARGAMPPEAAAATLAKDAEGNPLRQYHGTRSAFDEIDLTKAGSNDGTTLGPGFYTTPQTKLANEYAGIQPEHVDYLTDKANFAMKGFGSSEELGKHLDDMLGRISELDRTAIEHKTRLHQLESLTDPASRREYMLSQSEAIDSAREAQALRKQISPLQDGWIAMGNLGMLADQPRNVRMHYLDIRNPLDLRGTGFGEDNLHPVLAELQQRMKAGELATADKYKEALQAHGYDSVIAPHAGMAGVGQNLDQYVVFDPKQIYKPWVAPPQTPVPAAYGGPSPLRATLPHLGGLSAAQILQQHADTRQPRTMADSLAGVE